MISSMKKKIINYLILVLAIILVLYFTLKDNFNDIIYELKTVNIGIYLVAVLIFFISLIFKSLSLCNLSNEYKKYSAFKTYNLTLISLFLNGITPFQTGGQPFQIYLMKKDGFRISDATNAMISDCIVYQIALILIGFISLIANLFLGYFSMDRYLSIFVILGFILNVLVLVFLIVVTSAKKTGYKVVKKIINFLFNLKFMKRFENKKEDLIKSLEHFYFTGKKRKKSKNSIIFGIILNMIYLTLLYIVPIFIFESLKNVDITFMQAFTASSFVMILGNIIPIPGATGGIEYSFMQFFGKFVKGALLSSGMLLWRFTTYLLGLIVGSVVLMFKKGEKKR